MAAPQNYEPHTVLMPVSWQLIEPEEGRFDFTLVDGLLEDARAADLRAVLLWFDLWTGPEEYLGTGVTVTFAPADGAGQAGIESIREGRFVDGRWTPGRPLNGDESHQGRHLRLPPGRFGIQRVRLYRYR